MCPECLRFIGEAHPLHDANAGDLLHKVGTKEFKPPDSFCHLNYKYLHQRLLSKVS